MCYLFWFDSGNGPSHHLLERCCCTQHFGLCSRTVDHSARMGEYWSQGVERAVSIYLDYGQLAQHSMLSRFSSVPALRWSVDRRSPEEAKRSKNLTVRLVIAWASFDFAVAGNLF